jgi:uncharacterized protein YjbJ (UPF0337 family)
VGGVDERKESAMNWEQAEATWKQLKGDVRSKWAKLTDDDFELIAGKKDTLVGKLQERYGYVKDEAERVVDEWIDKLTPDKRT